MVGPRPAISQGAPDDARGHGPARPSEPSEPSEPAVTRLYGSSAHARDDTRPSPHQHALGRRALSILIVTHEAAERVDAQLELLTLAARYRDWQVIVVDNASTDGTAELVETRHPWAQLIRSPENVGYAAACNLAAREAQGALLLFMHPDTHAQPAMIARAAARMLVNPQVGIAGGRLLDTAGHDVPAPRRFPSALADAFAWRSPRVRATRPVRPSINPDLLPREPSRRVDWVSDAYAIMRHDLFRHLDGFDTRFFMYCEDIDLCRRVGEEGFEVMYWPDVRARQAPRVPAAPGFAPPAEEQRERWQMRSRLLYLHKHEGSTGAWLASRAESAWLALASLGYRCGSGLSPDAPGRLDAIARRERVRDVWRETGGGREAPPGPWR